MKTLAACGQSFEPPSEVFCLRERASEQFWDGEKWTEKIETARTFSDLHLALNVARRKIAYVVDLIVLFPSRARSLITLLG
jgi:hypothetical protein